MLKSKLHLFPGLFFLTRALYMYSRNNLNNPIILSPLSLNLVLCDIARLLALGTHSVCQLRARILTHKKPVFKMLGQDKCVII